MENQITGERIANLLTTKGVHYEQKRMFGGLCFMVEDKMLMGTYKGGLMVRVDPEDAAGLIEQNRVSQMIHGGKPMVGYLFIEPEAYESDQEMSFWIDKCLRFNPKAKTSKKK